MQCEHTWKHVLLLEQDGFGYLIYLLVFIRRIPLNIRVMTAKINYQGTLHCTLTF